MSANTSRHVFPWKSKTTRSMRGAACFVVLIESVHAGRTCVRDFVCFVPKGWHVLEVTDDGVDVMSTVGRPYISVAFLAFISHPYCHPVELFKNDTPSLHDFFPAGAANQKTASWLNMTSFCRASPASKRATIPCDDEPIWLPQKWKVVLACQRQNFR